MSHRAPQTTIDKIELREFFQDYSLEGDETIANVAHPGFEFVRDGWAAAVAVCNTYGHQDIGHDEPKKRAASHAADLLMTRPINPVAKIMEMFTVEVGSEEPIRDPEQPSLRELSRKFWEEVCHQARCDPGINEVRCTRIARDPYLANPNPQQATVRIRQPFPYPFPIINRTLHGFIRLLDGTFIPKSAIFFAMRLRSLDKLEAQLRDNPHTITDIYSVLFCMTAYYLGVEGASIAPFDGEFDLKFNRQAWLNTFEELGQEGSHVLGPAGYQQHRRFLLECEQQLFGFCEGAVRWWIPEETLKGTCERKMLKCQLTRMLNRVYALMDIDRHSPHHPIARSHTSPGPHTSP